MYWVSIVTYMCQFIYITEEGTTIRHERVCATDGHDQHTDEYVNGEWKPKI